MKSDKNFYKNLTSINNFLDIFKEESYRDVPENWFAVITDVKGSTNAIQEGRYKDVNVAGGISAMAISNIYKDMDYPFVFGGDGVTFLVPEEISSEVKEVLGDTKEKVKELFSLDLRIGMCKMKELYDQGFYQKIAKLKVSDSYNQAILDGNALDHFESIIKDPEKGKDFLLEFNPLAKNKADFSGFTCRWQDIKSSRGETISLIIKISENNRNPKKILMNLFEKIKTIFGEEKDYHPLAVDELKLAKTENYLGKEARAKSGKTSGLVYQFYLAYIKLEVAVMNFGIKHKLSIKPKAGMELGKLRELQIISSDFRKYDGTFKMVLSATTEKRKLLQDFLDKEENKGIIIYGLHISDRALMTCLMFEGTKKEVHFVDAADGGYALAARELKQKLKTYKQVHSA